MKLSTLFMIIGFLTAYLCLFISQVLPILRNKNTASAQNVVSKKMGLQLLSIRTQPKNNRLSIPLTILSAL